MSYPYYFNPYNTDQRVKEHVRGNPMLLKCFILFGVENEISIWSTFKILCEKYGDDAMDYPEFEFWYMRFSRGEFEMNYDRSSDPKTRFIDLPVHIFEKIAKDLSLAQRLNIRDVCKSLRSVVDSWDPAIKTISINTFSRSVELEFNGNVRLRPKMNGEEHPSVLTFNKLSTILKNPKLQLDRLEVRSLSNEHIAQFNTMFESLKQSQIHVERFSIVKRRESVDELKPLLSIQYFKPDVLKEISFDLNIGDDDFEEFCTLIDQVRRFKQFRDIEIFKIGEGEDPDMEMFEIFKECPRFTIQLDYVMSIMQLVELIKILMKSTVLERFNLCYAFGYTFNIRSINRRLGSEFMTAEDRPNVRRHKIPNSDQFYEIELTNEKITINRVE